MRRSASEVIKNLEKRIARLERQSSFERTQVPKSLISLAKRFRKNLVGMFKNSRSIIHTRKLDKVRTFPKFTGDKKFYQTILKIKNNRWDIILIEPVDGNYSNMPNSANVFWAGRDVSLAKNWITRNVDSGLLKPTIKDIVDALEGEWVDSAGTLKKHWITRRKGKHWEIMIHPSQMQSSEYILSEDENELHHIYYVDPLMESIAEILKKKINVKATWVEDFDEPNVDVGMSVWEKGYVALYVKPEFESGGIKINEEF